MLTKPEKLQALTQLQEANALRNKRSTMNFYGGSVEGRSHFKIDLYVRCTTSEPFYCVKISVARATQIRRLIVGKR